MPRTDQGGAGWADRAIGEIEAEEATRLSKRRAAYARSIVRADLVAVMVGPRTMRHRIKVTKAEARRAVAADPDGWEVFAEVAGDGALWMVMQPAADL